jgi:hypothetical protein
MDTAKSPLPMPETSDWKLQNALQNAVDQHNHAAMHVCTLCFLGPLAGHLNAPAQLEKDLASPYLTALGCHPYTRVLFRELMARRSTEEAADNVSLIACTPQLRTRRFT